MVPIQSRLPSNNAFDPETIQVLTATFEDAWREVRGKYRVGPDTDAVRNKLARLILAAANGGERDPAKLRADAITFLKLATPDHPA
jgi:hypothetical protein